MSGNWGKIEDTRMWAFREEILNTPQSLCAERAVLYTEAHRKHRNEQTAVLRAYCLENILENMNIYIEDKTLLVGNQASANRAAPVFIECAVDWLIEELDDIEKRDGDRFVVPDKEKERIRMLAPYWENNSLKDKALAAFPEKTRLYYDLGIIKSEGNITAGDGHLAVNYFKIIQLGLSNFKQHAKEALAKLDLTDYEQLKKSYFYKGVLIVLDAVIQFSHRYANLAEKMAESEQNHLRKAELLEIARICRKVPENPADTFYEAIQSIWFVHVILQIESSGHSLSYGRLDQYLYSYYKNDLTTGRMNDEGACILFENLWLKSMTINKIRSYAQSRYNAGSPMYQNVTIGGKEPDGSDSVNELSSIILRSVSRMRLTQPNLTVRYHSGMSSEFTKECIDVIRCGFGMPAFNNDEIIIPSFLKLHIKEGDAYNYSAIGCVEVAVPGKWGFRVTGMSFINFPRALMIAMNNGIDPASGIQVCEAHGHFTDMESFVQLMGAWDATVREITRQSVIADSCADMVLEQEIPDILCAALVDDCIERGLNLKEGGAVYDYISGLQVGIANLADSLAAIKYCVYEKEILTRKQLWDALCNDFEGRENENIRQILINSAPKYGNDIDYVDYLVVNAYESYMDEISKHRNIRYGRGPIGGKYFSGTSSVAANVALGLSTTATPDGRKSGEPLAEGSSPSRGMDTNGPTAVFKSLSKLKQNTITGGVLLNQKVTPQMLDREGNRKKLEILIRTYFDKLKGFHVQYNVVSRETMIDAQKHPEKHNDLIVRVAGYSAFFNVLSRKTQDDIIARTEQEL